MAAVSTVEMSSHDSDEIAHQMRSFLKGSLSHSRLNDDEIIRSAIYLLKSVPAAHRAVLEYLSQVFDEAVACLRNNEHEKKGPDPESALYENILLEIQSVVQEFIKYNPDVWAPIISSWSIELLGQISVKYGARRNMPSSSNLNELLQLWMRSYPTKILIEIVSVCFASVVTTNPEVCVDSLLEASVKYSPHFDWVVGHIGSCFPKTVINRVLMSGLEDYSTQSHGQLILPSDLDVKVPKLGSVVGILGHLAGHHSLDIQEALKGLFQKSLQKSNHPTHKCIIPFLLQIASLSSVLLRVLTTNFVETVTPKVLNQLAEQYRMEPSRDPQGLVNIVVHIITHSTDATYSFINYLLCLAEPAPVVEGSMDTDDHVNPVVRETCSTIMNLLLADLHNAVYRSTDSMANVPFLRALVSHCRPLSNQLAKASEQRSIWLCQILTLLIMKSSEEEGATVLSTLLTSVSSSQQLSMTLSICTEVSIQHPSILSATLAKLTSVLEERSSDSNRTQLVTNLLTLAKQERKDKEQFTGVQLNEALQQHLLYLSTHLVTCWSHDYSFMLLELVSIIDLPRMLCVEMATKLGGLWVTVLFNIIKMQDTSQQFKLSQICRSCLQKLCHSSTVAQNIVLRNILQGIFSSELCDLFGSTKDSVPSTAPSSLCLKSTLQRPLDTELKDSLSTHSRDKTFHAGVIGQGLRPRSNQNKLAKCQAEINKQVLVDVLWVCCHSNPLTSHSAPAGPETSHTSRHVTMTPDFARDLALIVLELVVPDVMYNSMLWPEEEFMKVTIERDLYIKKKFVENPILWDIMEFLSIAPGALSYCSALLRALMAVLLAFWESSQLKSTSESPWNLEASIKVVDLMRKGGLLASPLSYVGEVFPHLTPHEVQMILASIWRFMKENPPDPRCGRREGCHAHYLEILRNIMQANVHKLGHLYVRFFTDKGQT